MPGPQLAATGDYRVCYQRRRSSTVSRNAMTQLLQKAIAEIKKLPAEKQDDIAATILEELEDDAKWDETTRNNQDALGRWAEKVRNQIK
jgi:hypothetical protein